MKKGVFLLLLFWLLLPQPVYASEAELEELLDGLDFENVQKQIGQLPDELDFETLVRAFVNGEELDAKQIGGYFFDLFFYELEAAKPMFVQIFALGLLFSIFAKAAAVRSGYVASMGFFVVYMGMMLLLLQSFSLVSGVVEDAVEHLLSFMTAFVPMYAATLLLAGSGGSAGAFYELAFSLMYVLELGMRFVFLPGTQIYVLLLLLDGMLEQPRLAKLAKLLEDGIRLLLKAGFAGVMGIGVVQSLLAPARDRLAASGIYRSLSAVPGVGNTFGSAIEILTGCGILIKNSVGAAALVVLCALAAAPLLQVFCFLAAYRLAAALLAAGNSRLSQSVQAAASGCALLWTLIGDTVFLFFITISMISASSAFIQ